MIIRKYWPLLIVIFFGLLAAKGLIGSGYFMMHDDLQMMRQLEMEKCFLTLQIPCRWVPDMGYGFGYPLFNFYPPLPYLFGQIFRVLGATFVDTAKLTFIFAFISSGITMYFLAKNFFGKWGGIVSSIFYIWAPYHAVDIYVRGAMNEAWALIFFPATLTSSYLLLTEKKNTKIRNIIFLALGWVGLLLSHNLMAMIFAPIFAVWCLIWIVRDGKLKNIKDLANKIITLGTSGVLALGLAAFFTLPVVLEQKLVQTETLIGGYYDYSSHFVTIKQLLFSRFWGYGPSVWEANDGMSFQVGIVNWVVVVIVIITILFLISRQIFKKRLKIENTYLIVGYFFLVGAIAMFMTHNKSTPLWLNINTLKFVQFPWRFLTLVIFSFSIIAGALVFMVKGFKLKLTAVSLLIGALLIFNWDYFNVQGNKLSKLTDSEKFQGAALDLQRTASIYDYLPKTAKTAPKAPMTEFVEVLEGDAEINNLNVGTNKHSFNINVENDTRVRLGLFDFPEWRVYVDGVNVDTFIPETEEWGRIHFLITKGEHKVRVELKNTSIRNVSNITSLISWAGLIGFVIVKSKKTKSIKKR